MTHFDRNGAVIVCTSTKAEYDASADAEPVHFVASERYEPVGD